jgi:hypothetical protein
LPEKDPNPRRPVIAIFTSHWLAMVGLGLVLTGLVAWISLMPARLRSGHENPYIGVATSVAVVLVVLGVVIAPIGLWLGRRRLERSVEFLRSGGTAWMRLAIFFLVVSGLNLLVAGQGAQTAVHHLESNEFCLSCHAVHDPQARAIHEGPHASIQCVECHVGEGNAGFLKAKLQGTQQLWAVLTDSVHHPIEGPIARGLMVPAAETCEDCHWKLQPAAARVKLIQRYAPDEANTPETTLLTMNVGGRKMGGIHGAHHGDGIEIRFVATDSNRQDIPLVEYVNTATGVERTYVRKGTDAASLAGSPRIGMQCYDCHNRPAHAFQMPDRAVDQAITMGRMSASLPFLKKQAVEILTKDYASRDAAATEIPAALAAYYASTHPDVARARADEIAEAGRVVADIHARNVYPESKVTWGTYPDNRGHQEWPGCFRCHDGEHVADSGETITNNCFRCHHPAAVGETQPEILDILGVEKLLRNQQKKK